MEIIGHEREFQAEPSEDIKSRFYSSTGDTLDYVYELEGDILTIWFGERGSPAYYRGTFSEDGNVLTGAWHYPGGGGYEANEGSLLHYQTPGRVHTLLNEGPREKLRCQPKTEETRHRKASMTVLQTMFHEEIRKMTTSTRQRNPLALGGVLFAVLFLVGGVLGGALASVPLPLPGAPVAEVARYFTESRTAVLTSGLFQLLSAVSLFVFVVPVAAFVRRMAGERRALIGLTSGGGILSAVFLLVSALLGWVLALTAGGLGLDLVDTLRGLNFLTGGTLHVATLGLFVGATSIAARKAKALPRWISWLGIVQATLAILSLASLLYFPAALLILLGRLLGFVWCIAVGIVLALGMRRATGAGR